VNRSQACGVVWLAQQVVPSRHGHAWWAGQGQFGRRDIVCLRPRPKAVGQQKGRKRQSDFLGGGSLLTRVTTETKGRSSGHGAGSTYDAPAEGSYGVTNILSATCTATAWSVHVGHPTGCFINVRRSAAHVARLPRVEPSASATTSAYVTAAVVVRCNALSRSGGASSPSSHGVVINWRDSDEETGWQEGQTTLRRRHESAALIPRCPLPIALIFFLVSLLFLGMRTAISLFPSFLGFESMVGFSFVPIPSAFFVPIARLRCNNNMPYRNLSRPLTFVGSRTTQRCKKGTALNTLLKSMPSFLPHGHTNHRFL
jgi:hypothetical protein